MTALRIAVMLSGATASALLVAHVLLCLLIVAVTVSTMIMLYVHTH